MAIVRRVFGPVGQAGTLEVGVTAGGGHILVAALAVASPASTFLLEPAQKSFSAYGWRLPVTAGQPVSVVVRSPADPPTIALPWVGGAVGFLRARLAIAIFSGSGANALNLSADVQVLLDGAPLPPTPPAPMTFPTAPMTTPDISRTALVELVFNR